MTAVYVISRRHPDKRNVTLFVLREPVSGGSPWTWTEWRGRALRFDLDRATTLVRAWNGRPEWMRERGIEARVEIADPPRSPVAEAA